MKVQILMKIVEIEIINPGGMFFSDMTIAQPLPDYPAVLVSMRALSLLCLGLLLVSLINKVFNISATLLLMYSEPLSAWKLSIRKG